MSTRSCAAALLALALATGCVAWPAPAASPRPAGPLAVIETSDADVRVRVEIAADPEERARGLMFRDELAEDAGMVFLFEDDTRAHFHMQNVRIPLSIAFVSADGEILRILDMVPCPARPCPSYDPEVAYRMALEVERGAFERWGVRVGDSVRLLPSAR